MIEDGLFTRDVLLEGIRETEVWTLLFIVEQLSLVLLAAYPSCAEP